MFSCLYETSDTVYSIEYKGLLYTVLYITKIMCRRLFSIRFYNTLVSSKRFNHGGSMESVRVRFAPSPTGKLIVCILRAS